MQLACYFDYTCGYSYRAWRWIEGLRAHGMDLEVEWLSFVLKEVNRGDEPSPLAGPGIDSVAVLALAIGEALRDTPAAEGFRRDVFEAMHPADADRAGKDDVVRIAVRNGLDLGEFQGHENEWLEKVRTHHDRGRRRGVFGTPTLVLDGEASIYFKLEALPAGDERALWDSILEIMRDYPELTELKRPSPSP